MLAHLLFWFTLIVFVGGHAWLVHAAWRLRRAIRPPEGFPPYHSRADLGWTLTTAGLTAVMLYMAYTALP